VTAPKTPPRPAGKVPRPTPPKYHVDRDKTPVPGTYLDHGEGFGGNPARRPPSLPPGLKLGPQIHTAVQAAERLSHELPTRGYDVAEVREIAQQEARARGQSAKMAAVRTIEAHEKADKRVLAFWTATAVAFIGGLAMLGKSIVDNSGELARGRAETQAVKAATEKVAAMVRPLERLTERIEAEQEARRRDVDRLEAKIDRIPSANPDLVSAVRRGLAGEPGQK